MCTFKDERAVLVCDVAIGRVREEIEAAFTGGDGVRYMVVDGQGMLGAASPGIDAERLTTGARTALAEAQETTSTSRAGLGRHVPPALGQACSRGSWPMVVREAV
jgi:hypothetical protein